VEVVARLAVVEQQLDRLRQLEEIRHLRERYCRYVDARRWDDLASILTVDYRHYSTNTVVAAPTLVADSSAAFLERVRAVTAGAITVHACFMPDIAVRDAAHATGRWSMTDVVSHPTDPRMRFAGHGHYDDEYVRGDDLVWRIAVARLTRQRLDPLPLREADQAPGLPYPDGAS
jgi:hypothetical protein